MEPIELDKLIGELEVGVDRLRALYEQYFMGFEKLEPTVPRKDVDRRIHALRKEQIRNTALRFRFQMVIQRYNTYQTHWQRICREIENGTYKRHVTRAQRRFEGEAARAPVQVLSPTEMLSLAEEAATPPYPFPAAAPVEPEEDLAVPAAIDLPTPVPTAGPKKPASPWGPPPLASMARPAPGGALPDDLAAELAELDKEFAPAAATPQRGGHVPPNAPPLASAAATRGVSAPRPQMPPGSSARPVAPPPAAGGSPPSPWRRLVPQPPAAVPAATPGTTSKAPPLPATAIKISAPSPSPATAAPPAKAAGPAGAPIAPSTPASRDEDLPDQRMRQLYSEYVEARRKQNESTADVPYEAIAKNLRESGARLREKHGKPVDFEVMVKDGKTFLRPILK